MELLMKMQKELELLWQGALHAENYEMRDDLLKKYRLEHARFRKQVVYLTALQERPTRNSTSHLNI